MYRAQCGRLTAPADRRLTMHHATMQGAFKYHQYQVVGRHLPTEHNENPELYRMKLWATDAVAAKSKFWCATALPPPSRPPFFRQPPGPPLPAPQAAQASIARRSIATC